MYKYLMLGMIENLNLGTTVIVLYDITKKRREFKNTHKDSILNL